MHTVQNEKLTMFELQKKLSFEQHNKQFANYCKHSVGPPVAFTHAFNILVKFNHPRYLQVVPYITRLCYGVFTRSSKRPANFQQMYSKYTC